MTDRKNDSNFTEDNIVGLYVTGRILAFVKDGMNITQVYNSVRDKNKDVSPGSIIKAVTQLIDNDYLIKKQIDGKGYSKRDRYLFLTDKGKKIQKDVITIYNIIKGWNQK